MFLYKYKNQFGDKHHYFVYGSLQRLRFLKETKIPNIITDKLLKLVYKYLLNTIPTSKTDLKVSICMKETKLHVSKSKFVEFENK